MDVLATTRAVVANAKHVFINDVAIEGWADTWQPVPIRQHDFPLDDARGTRDEIANLVLLIDSLNFCFWSEWPMFAMWRGRRVERYMALAAAVTAAAMLDRRWLDPRYWAEMTLDELLAHWRAEGILLLIYERVDIIRETGRILLEHFAGQFSNVVLAAGGDARRLAELIAQQFPSFCDKASYNGADVWFLKRAQICAADLALAWSMRRYGSLDGLERLTAFADYRMPQILRHLGILTVTPQMTETIAAQRELPPGSEEEVELRAATIQAVDRMQAALAKRRREVPAWQIDVDLWVASHSADMSVEHHRTRTIYY